MNNNDLVRPALISGVAFGVATAVPPFSIFNVCTCCSLYAAAGFLSAYLLKKDSPVPITTGQGALAGLASGIAGGVIHTLFSIPVTLLFDSLIPFNQELVEKLLAALGDDSHPLARLLQELGSQGSDTIALFSLAWFFVLISKLLITVVIFGLLAMLGGILAVAILEKRPPTARYSPPSVPVEKVTPPPPPVPPVDPE